MNPVHSDAVPVFMKRGWMPVWRFGIAVTLSFVLMTIDARFKYLNVVRYSLAAMAFPIQRVAAVPQYQWWHFGQWFTLQSTLIDENQRLRAELLQTVSLRTELEGIRNENEEFRALLALRPNYASSTITATFLYRSRIPTEQKIIIDQGEKEGIQLGQAVADGKGVLGQITHVYPFLSEVTLITNIDYAVPIKVERTGQFGVVYGRGIGHPLELRFATQDMDLKEGDLLITSGIDGVYPTNLPVATVQRLTRKTDTMFLHVECTPIAQLDRHQHMLVFSLPPIKERPISELSPKFPSTISKRYRR